MKDLIKKYYDIVKKQSLLYDKSQKCNIGQTWKYHLMPVIKNALYLAELYGADKAIVEVAALFHDYANLLEFSDENSHHKVGADIAREILIKDGFNRDFSERVAGAIFNHRASVVIDKHSAEDICVADGDALAHFDNVVELLLWRGYLGEDIETANNFVKSKIEKSYRKMSEATKDLVKDRYESIMKIFY